MLILVRPHTSLLDGPKVALQLRIMGIRGAIFPVDPDYARHPVWGRLLKAYGWLLGRQEMRAMDSSKPYALRELALLLKAGRTVVLFPQGTGLSDPHGPDQPGAAWLMCVTGVSVVEWDLSTRTSRYRKGTIYG
jgi:1-acyl-sn-glycerol-3-phosphate acyltransferase